MARNLKLLADGPALKHKRRRAPQASDFPFMRGKNPRRRSGKWAIRNFFLDDRTEEVPGRGDIACDEDQAGSETGDNQA
jgi:hypothetical protein